METGLRGGMQDKLAQSAADLLIRPVGMFLAQNRLPELAHFLDAAHSELQALGRCHLSQRRDLCRVKTFTHVFSQIT